MLEHRTWEGTTVPETGTFGWFPDTSHFVEADKALWAHPELSAELVVTSCPRSAAG